MTHDGPMDIDARTLEPQDIDRTGHLRSSGLDRFPADGPARMLSDVLEHVERVRELPVWQPMPDVARERLCTALPFQGRPLDEVHADFMESILPYVAGNLHPRFMGWVHGAGTPAGMLAEMLAGGLNANVAGRNQAPVLLERLVVSWMANVFGLPASFIRIVGHGNIDWRNLIGILVARGTPALPEGVRKAGIPRAGPRLSAYTSAAAHFSIVRALEICGLGHNDALRVIAVDDDGRIRTDHLVERVARDQDSGAYKPFLVVGTAGSASTGAIDDLDKLADVAAAEGIWFHVDGAYGALAMLSPELAPKLRGIERADSIAFDFHKWGHVPYDAGMFMARDARMHQAKPSQSGVAIFIARTTWVSSG